LIASRCAQRQGRNPTRGDSIDPRSSSRELLEWSAFRGAVDEYTALQLLFAMRLARTSAITAHRARREFDAESADLGAHRSAERNSRTRHARAKKTNVNVRLLASCLGTVPAHERRTQHARVGLKSHLRSN